MSHSIHMLSIQIDTKKFQFNNIQLSFFASHMKRSTILTILKHCGFLYCYKFGCNFP